MRLFRRRNILNIQHVWSFLKKDLFQTAELKDAQVKMPALSPTMSSGTIVKWAKNEGDSVAPGDVLCEIQTDKAVVAMETDDEGILAKILVAENTPDVAVGRLIALIVDEGKDWKNVQLPPDVQSEKINDKIATNEAAPPTLSVDIDKSAASSAIPFKGDSVIGPAARLLLRHYQIDPKSVDRTVHKRAVLKHEVMDYIAKNKLSPKPIEIPKPPSQKPVSVASAKVAQPSLRRLRFEDKPISKERRENAAQLLSSKFYTPHAYNRVSVNLNEAEAVLRNRDNSYVHVGYRDFVLNACVHSLREIPQMNVYFDGENVKQFISIDVALYNGNMESFVAPVIRRLDTLNVEQIAMSCTVILDQIRSGNPSQLDLDPAPFGFVDASETGLTELTAILRGSQTFVVCLGAPFAELNSNLQTSHKSFITLTYDNRAIDDQTASAFLHSLKANVENCSRMLMGVTKQSVRSL